MSFKTEVLAHGETEWARNGLTFETQKESDDYGADLFDRWTMVKEVRTVPSDATPNYTFLNGKLKDIDYRKTELYLGMDAVQATMIIDGSENYLHELIACQWLFDTGMHVGLQGRYTRLIYSHLDSMEIKD